MYCTVYTLVKKLSIIFYSGVIIPDGTFRDRSVELVTLMTMTF